MKLYQAAASPFVRKVNVLLHETDQFGDVTPVHVAITPTASAAEVNAANPLGKIPTLERADGPALYDSRVICRYLDARVGAGLYPESRIWETLTLEAMADGIMDAAVLMVYEKRVRPEDKQFEGWRDAQWQKVDRALHAISTRWMSHLKGRMDASHIATGCALGYLDFRHPDRGWRSGHDALSSWFAEFESRDSMQATKPA
ncbi:MAG: glutathione S-transferase [Pseudomonadota bacterium]